MRFPQLPIGQRFGYQGKTFTKTGPLTASEEGTGKSQLIKKSAEVAPLDFQPQPTEEKRQYNRQEVAELFARYRAGLTEAVVARAGPQTSLPVQDVLEIIAAKTLPKD
jgi:hypothetical protein